MNIILLVKMYLLLRYIAPVAWLIGSVMIRMDDRRKPEGVTSSVYVSLNRDHGFMRTVFEDCRSQWPRGLRCRSTAARLLRSWVRIPPWAWMFVCCECCVLSGRGLCDELITRPEESYRLWCVVVCDLETTKILVNEEEAKAH